MTNMYEVDTTTKYKRSLKKFIKKRLIDLDELDKVIISLAKKENLPKKYKNHKLTNNLSDFWECHIHSDVLLLHYAIDEDEKLVLYNLTTHDGLKKM